MIEFGLVNFLWISIPEEFLILLITMLVIGYKAILNFKDRKNLLKIIFTVTITALFSGTIHNFNLDELLISIIQVVFFIFIYVEVYKIEVFKIAISFLITMIVFLLMDAFSIIIMNIITGLTYFELKPNTLMFVLFCLPGRLIEIVLSFVLYKSKVVILNLDPIKIYIKNVLKRITIIYIIISIMFITVSNILLLFIFGFNSKNLGDFSYQIISSLLAIVLLALTIVYVHKESEKAAKESEERKYNLDWFEHLINKHGSDMISLRNEIKRIKENGYYE